jgi:hypothetical protein
MQAAQQAVVLALYDPRQHSWMHVCGSILPQARTAAMPWQQQIQMKHCQMRRTSRVLAVVSTVPALQI